MSIALPNRVVAAEFVPFRRQETGDQPRWNTDASEHEHHCRRIMFAIASLPGKQELVNRMTGGSRIRLKAVCIVGQEMVEDSCSLLVGRTEALRHAVSEARNAI